MLNGIGMQIANFASNALGSVMNAGRDGGAGGGANAGMGNNLLGGIFNVFSSITSMFGGGGLGGLLGGGAGGAAGGLGGILGGGGGNGGLLGGMLGGLINQFLPGLGGLFGGGAGGAGGAGGGQQGGIDAGAGAGGIGQPQAPGAGAPGGGLPGAVVGGDGAGDADGVVVGGGANEVADPADITGGYRTQKIATAGQGGGQADARGNLFVASERDIKIFDANFREIGGFRVPEGAADVAPSPDGNSAFVSSRIGDGYEIRRYAKGNNGQWQLDRGFKLEPFEFGGRMQKAEGMRISTDHQGNLYVANGMWTSNSLNTVAKFDANGRFLTRFGSFVDGNANDESSWEQGRFYWGLGGVTSSNDGKYVYTTEVGNSRVQRWDLQEDGSYAPSIMWGNDAETDPERTGRDDPGHFAAPYDVGVDQQGNVYVMNTSATQVQRFSPNGEHLASVEVGTGKAGERTHGIAVNARGDFVSVETGMVARR